ncbi:glycosyltransferase family 2 protein [Candidatus Saccharibacteria bacterium]|nr:glycosyltransferase family 2 protein [Candidatus Saccharibacteria bacterium]
MDISIVVPVYNTKRFLKDCVTGLIQLGEVDFSYEILLIDNGSSDGGYNFCKGFRDKCREVKLLKCEEPGAAAVRNFGLREAKGKYIWFVDSDDYVDPEAVSLILKRFKETKADVVVLGAEKVAEDKTALGVTLPAVRTPLDDPKVTRAEFTSKFIRYGLAPWQVPAKREFLLKNELFYDEGMIHEDMALISSFVLYTDKIASIEKPIYFYRQRKNSVLHGESWNESQLDIFKALELLSKRFEKAKKFKKYKAELEYFYIWNLLDDAAHEFKKFPEGRKHFSEVRSALKKRFPEWRKNKYFRECPLMVRLRCETAYYGIVW